MNKKEKLTTALEIYKQIQDQGGLEELPKSKKVKLLKDFMSLFNSNEYEIDGDSDGCLIIIPIEKNGDGTIYISSYAEYYDVEEIIEKAYSISAEDFEISFEEYVSQMKEDKINKEELKKDLDNIIKAINKLYKKYGL